MKKKNNLYFFKKIKKDFDGIYKACGNKFFYSCGSYLINGKSYRYDKEMLNKQLLLYNLAKKHKTVLEVGVYMGHSILIMLASNPKLEPIKCISALGNLSLISSPMAIAGNRCPPVPPPAIIILELSKI